MKRSLSIRHYSKLKSILTKQLSEIREQGLYKEERQITTPQDAHILTKKTKEADILNFCANNYLGLSNHPLLKDAAVRSLESHGFGMSSVRFICGTQDLHKDLERKIAEFHQMEDCITYISCFDANAGFFETILTPEDAVISDELNHASIIDGIRLCKADRHRYKHMDMKELEDKLQKTQDKRLRFVVTDGVFSMDGDIAPLDKIADLCQKYDANLFVDDCHSSGFFGKNGRGTAEYFGVESAVDVINSTLGKALSGGNGGYTVASKEIVDLLRQKSRPYLFSNAIAPPIVGASIKALELSANDDTLRNRLMKVNTPRFRTQMKKAGFDISGHDDCPIAPVMIYDERKAMEIADAMLEEGIYVIAFSYPVVPRGKARIRVQLSASHTIEDIDRTVEAFTRIGKQHGII